MGLCGTSESHCCWIRGVQCPYVVPSPNEGFAWACSLRLQEPDWQAVYARSEYTSIVRPSLTEAGIVQDCGDWPPAGVTCNDCGEVG